MNELTARRGKRLVTILVLLLTGCASTQAPQVIREAPALRITVTQVQRQPDRFLGRRVRWGGTILAVHNGQRTTEIEILSRPLDADGEPQGKEPGEGRFIAQLAGFADPAEYPTKRLLTVSGRLVGVETRPIGEFPYAYPVLVVARTYLWPEQAASPPPYYYPLPWYHPWYRPWSPGYWYY